MKKELGVNLKPAILILGWLFLIACGCSSSYVTSQTRSVVETVQPSSVNTTNQAEAKSLSKNINCESEPVRYLGCWHDKKGTKIRFRSEMVYDLKSKEKSRYKEVSSKTNKVVNDETQQQEEYLVETESVFKTSFLAKYIRITPHSSGTIVTYTTYKSYDDYLTNKIFRQGVFERMTCQ